MWNMMPPGNYQNLEIYMVTFEDYEYVYTRGSRWEPIAPMRFRTSQYLQRVQKGDGVPNGVG